MRCAHPARSALRLRHAHHLQRGVGREHAMPAAREVNGVFAGAAADLEQRLALREHALEVSPGDPAQQRSQRGRRELRVVLLRQSVEGRCVIRYAHCASLRPLTVRLTQRERLDVMKVVPIQAVLRRCRIGVMTQRLPLPVCQERPQAFAPGAAEYGLFEIRAIRFGERLRCARWRTVCTRPTRRPARCSSPTSPRMRAVSCTASP